MFTLQHQAFKDREMAELCQQCVIKLSPSTLACMYSIILFEYLILNLFFYLTPASFGAESGQSSGLELGLFSEEDFCLRHLIQKLVGEQGMCHWVARERMVS